MEISINPPESHPKHQNTFVVLLEFMHGDMDYFTTEEVVLKDANEVEAFVETIKWLRSLDPVYGRLGGYTRQSKDVSVDPRYTRFFQSYTLAEFEEDSKDGTFYYKTYAEALHGGWGEDLWPRDKTNYDYPASLSSVTYLWFDERGVEHTVTIKE